VCVRVVVCVCVCVCVCARAPACARGRARMRAAKLPNTIAVGSAYYVLYHMPNYKSAALMHWLGVPLGRYACEKAVQQFADCRS
jgi:hypothetical protein